MIFIKNKIKYFIFSYLKYKKKDIYNMIYNNIIITLKNYFFNILLDLIKLSYIFLKFYRVFFYTKIILDQIPMCNNYIWPFSILRIICKPYLKFWTRILPKIKLGNSIFDISSLVAIEFLSNLSNILNFLKIIILKYAKN